MSFWNWEGKTAGKNRILPQTLRMKGALQQWLNLSENKALAATSPSYQPAATLVLGRGTVPHGGHKREPASASLRHLGLCLAPRFSLRTNGHYFLHAGDHPADTTPSGLERTLPDPSAGAGPEGGPGEGWP